MNKKGFTLVELLAVLVLLALIAIIIVPNALRTTSKTEKKAFVESVKGIIRGVSEYYAETGGVLPRTWYREQWLCFHKFQRWVDRPA